MRGVTILKAEDDKTKTLNSHTLIAYAGESGDTGMVSFDGNLMGGRRDSGPGAYPTICPSCAQFSLPSTSRPTSSSTACAITLAGNFPPLQLHRSSVGSLQERFDQGSARLPARLHQSPPGC